MTNNNSPEPTRCPECGFAYLFDRLFRNEDIQRSGAVYRCPSCFDEHSV